MKKIVFLLFLLFIAWCSSTDKVYENKNFDNEKKCADMRNDFVDYLDTKYHFIDEPAVIEVGNWQQDWYVTNELYDNHDWIDYNILKKIKVFYNEWMDSCIWVYLLHNYYPTAWWHMDIYNWFAEDILKDEVIDERYDIEIDEFDSIESFRRTVKRKPNK